MEFLIYEYYLSVRVRALKSERFRFCENRIEFAAFRAPFARKFKVANRANRRQR